MRGARVAAFVLCCGTAVPSAAQPQESPHAAIERVYTPLDLGRCRHTRGRAEEDYGSWRCAGHAGIAVLVRAGDQRTYVSFGVNAAKEPAARQTLAAFNSAGTTIEWRIARDSGDPARPFAAILRWNTTRTDDGGNPVRGQVLVVTRLGPGGVCHVGYVDGRANPNANELAQRIADERARSFHCAKDKPVVLGAKGPGFSGPYGE
ncbi:MAG: hypothetical protein FJX62_07050 [Alphaproteobacteria bacterium]|nr:hypothetical protein [Alphaproteobacteria bacterium]